MYLKDYFLMFISLIILVICVLIGVAFLTLLERKVLGYIQIRSGPNKVGFWGILQPFSDAIKLFTKESVYPLKSNYLIYMISPVFNLFLSLLMWVVMPFFTNLFSFSLGLLFFLSVSSLSVYSIMIAGWSSNSNYAMLGCLRSVAQTISYEVSLSLMMLSFFILLMSMNLQMFMKLQKHIWFFFLTIPLSMMFFVSGLAETNRTPFDFAEGESELVSGFNVEYSSGGFALIFMAEYGSILFMSSLCCILFLGCDIYSFMFFIKLGFMSFFWIWVRGTLPRFRYDKLMNLAWKSFLPVSLNYLLFFISLKFMIMMFIML
uniref:NADH-ubiquinone oxidoreductase chain 1 n=1 Tax=Staphylinoidea sp. 14 KM-2017 TaxID=2219454 RepID=A0A346RJ33_9COLE|nr:NADH dehydrogenase subunit 1 [Staphylinoidea sp. 14 KM-2017]